MNLLTILKTSMALVGLPDDEDTLELWRPKLTFWCNEALCDLGLSLRPWSREEMTLEEGGYLYPDALYYPCIKVLGVEKEGKRFPFYYAGSARDILIPGLKEGDTVEVVYRYMPPAIEKDWEEPQLPEGYHNLLVSYIAAKEKAQLDAGAYNVGRFSMALYEQQKQAWIKNQPGPWENRFYNML